MPWQLGPTMRTPLSSTARLSSSSSLRPSAPVSRKPAVSTTANGMLALPQSRIACATPGAGTATMARSHGCADRHGVRIALEPVHLRILRIDEIQAALVAGILERLDRMPADAGEVRRCPDDGNGLRVKQALEAHVLSSGWMQGTKIAGRALQPMRPSGVDSGKPEHGAALEPRVGPVARLAVEGVQPLQDEQHALGADAVPPLDRPERVAEPELGALVDVGRRGDAALGHAAADIDDHGDDALRHEARAVVDDDHRLAVGGEQAVRGVAGDGPGGGRHHQRARALHAEQHIDGDGPLRIQLEIDARRGQVPADGREHDQRVGARLGRRFERRRRPA